MRKKKIDKHSLLLTFLIHCLFHPFHLVYLLRPSYSSPYLCLFFSNILILCITIPPPFFSFLSSSLSLSLVPSISMLILFCSAVFLFPLHDYSIHTTFDFFFASLFFSSVSLFLHYITLHYNTHKIQPTIPIPHPPTYTHTQTQTYTQQSPFYKPSLKSTLPVISLIFRIQQYLLLISNLHLYINVLAPSTHPPSLPLAIFLSYCFVNISCSLLL